jgi:exodeoxyribonuclease V alpha subunit
MQDRITHLDARRPGSATGNSIPTNEELDALTAPYLAADGYVGLLAAELIARGSRSTALLAPKLHVALLDALNRYRVLAVHRRGPRGVAGLDRAIAKRVRGKLEQAIREHAGLGENEPVRLPSSGSHYLGQPVLVTENTYEVGLMNGDIGLVLPTAHGLAAIFPSYGAGQLSCREVALARLPAHMGAFAMTVHKSQGSQFERVALVLAGRDSPIQTRELVYTGITRTSGRLDWLGDADELRRALDRPIQRASGLRELLRESPG